MDDSIAKNSGRFSGFAGLYDQTRPAMPFYPVEVITRYLGRKPEIVIDLGCGTGLSSSVWKNRCEELVGIDPSEDMLVVARQKETAGFSFRKGFSSGTGMPDQSVDVVVCSQSFHWMEPHSSLQEINRILKPGGIFSTVDCDWPPVSDWRVEKAYTDLFGKISCIEKTDDQVKTSFVRWDKDDHLTNIRQSGYFSYTREIFFSNRETCDAERLIGLAKSQGGLQTVLKYRPELIESDMGAFVKTVHAVFGDRVFDIDFGYRMRMGIK